MYNYIILIYVFIYFASSIRIGILTLPLSEEKGPLIIEQECYNKTNITNKNELFKLTMNNNDAAYCYDACILKKKGLIDSENRLIIDKVIENIEKIILNPFLNGISKDLWYTCDEILNEYQYDNECDITKDLVLCAIEEIIKKDDTKIVIECLEKNQLSISNLTAGIHVQNDQTNFTSCVWQEKKLIIDGKINEAAIEHIIKNSENMLIPLFERTNLKESIEKVKECSEKINDIDYNDDKSLITEFEKCVSNKISLVVIIQVKIQAIFFNVSHKNFTVDYDILEK